METTETSVSLQGHLVHVPLRLPLEAELAGRVVHIHDHLYWVCIWVDRCTHLHTLEKERSRPSLGVVRWVVAPG